MITVHRLDYRKTYRRNLLGQVDLLRQDHAALLKGALQINILDLVTQVHGLLHQSDNTPLDFNVHDGTLGDGFVESTRGGNGEGLATNADAGC
jgi:hypothetical protein